MTEGNTNILIVGVCIVTFLGAVLTACVIDDQIKSNCILNSTQVLQIEKCSH